MYNVVTMFIDDATLTRNGKPYRRVLLRNSYRVNGHVRHDTLANLSHCSDEEIRAIKLALKYKGQLSPVGNLREEIGTRQGLAVGAVWVLHQLAKRLGLVKALGQGRTATLALWLVLANVIAPGSRLSAVRLAQQHAVCDLLALEAFNEDDLYQALDWLAEQQPAIEETLFAHRYASAGQAPVLYLYDVTSSYLEGDQNELGEYGYNRDGKKGKKQIVIGLLTDEEGWPITGEVFAGNTQDPKTFKAQINKLVQRFGVKQVTLVGDRGMIKTTQISDLKEEGFHYLTAITKPQIEALLKTDSLQWSMFDDDLVEVTTEEVRYIARRNPQRAEELAAVRRSKRARLEKYLAEKNAYLAEHPRARVETALKQAHAKAERLKIQAWATLTVAARCLALTVDEDTQRAAARLDGCYVIKTDLSPEVASSATAHARYKGLAELEYAFRTMKTTLLEMRGIFVRKATRTRAHVFVIMLAYLLAYQLRRLWQEVELTVEEGIAELASICALELTLPNQAACQVIPEPRPLGKRLLEKAGITLPDAIPHKGITVVTRKKLVPQRKPM
jgi:transposase